MSLTSSVGLIGIFFVDLLDMYFLSLLGQAELAAAVGYAGSVLFFTTSICIGISIATGIIQAKLIGAEKHEQAKRELAGSMLTCLLIALLVLSFLYPSIEWLLGLLGADGKTLAYAASYLKIVVPTLPFLALAMAFSAVLRSLGAAKSAMMTTLSGSIVNGVLDPIFIFTLGLGVEGAAMASALARITMFLVAAFILARKYHYFVLSNRAATLHSAKSTFYLSIPAVLTNFATPVGNAYIVSVISDYGDSAVAGFSIIGRIIPVAFAIIFALSGAVGPIIGQNLGAKIYRRINKTINFSYSFVAAYVLFISLMLALSSGWLVQLFHATGDAEELLTLFCHYLALSFMFTGITFVSNAVFNNLGKPHYSTVMNWLKATVGTIPFVYFGSVYWGAPGILIGQAIGNIVFGFISFFAVKYFVKDMIKRKKGAA